MRVAWRRQRGRGLIAALIVATFGVHALIPAGFMPGGAPLSIRICPDGFPGQLLTHLKHHTHGGSPAHTEHCAFGGAGTVGPLTCLSPLAEASAARHAAAVDVLSVAAAVRLVHLPQPRAPPGRLS